MVEVDRTWLAVLCVFCCVPSVALWMRLRLQQFRERHGSARTAPAHFAETVLDGLMMGVGTGLAAATVVLLVEVIVFLVMPGRG